MATKTIEVADALDAADFPPGHRPSLGFAVDPTPPPAVVEHFVMNAQRVDGSHVTWVTAGAPDPSGASAPSGATIVTASIVLVKRGLFY